MNKSSTSAVFRTCTSCCLLLEGSCLSVFYEFGASVIGQTDVYANFQLTPGICLHLFIHVYMCVYMYICVYACVHILNTISNVKTNPTQHNT
ncbi:hypothetical protein EDC96DRAFT_530434, partial [Choanephora cucurbitarum]